MRPEWLISIAASGRASAGQRWQWLATCWATNDVIEIPASATWPPKRARHHAISSADSIAWPAIRSIVAAGAAAKNGSPP